MAPDTEDLNDNCQIRYRLLHLMPASNRQAIDKLDAVDEQRSGTLEEDGSKMVAEGSPTKANYL
jgi:hypothetical protein